MPNYCDNKVYFVGDESRVARLLADITIDGEIDFRRARPMPKELSGVEVPVRIVFQEEWKKVVGEREAAIARRNEGPSADEYAKYLADQNQQRAALAARPTQPPGSEPDAVLARLKEDELQGPDPTYEEWAKKVVDNTHIPALPLTQTMSDEYKRQFGHDNWYDWEIANWGAECGPFDIEPLSIETMRPFVGFAEFAHPVTGEPRAAYSYCSAWHPCRELFRYMSETYPDIAIVHPFSSWESGFRGICVFIKGVPVRNEYEVYDPFEEEQDERVKGNWKEEGF